MITIRRLFSRLRGEQRGSMAVELVVLTPALILIILLLVAGGRLALAGNQAQAAAVAAAREASLSRTATQAQTAATAAAQQAMAQAGYQCTNLQVLINDAGLNVPLGEVGTVTATITCVLNMSDIALPGLPGTKTLTAAAQSPVDAYRERP